MRPSTRVLQVPFFDIQRDQNKGNIAYNVENAIRV